MSWNVVLYIHYSCYYYRGQSLTDYCTVGHDEVSGKDAQGLWTPCGVRVYCGYTIIIDL